MNILILSCGTRDLLVRYFKAASFEKIVVTDCSKLAPALYEADSYHIVPRMDASNYLEVILDICEQEKVSAILPLQEDELNWLADNRAAFEAMGIIPIVSNSQALEICRDKFQFYCHLKENKIPVLASYNNIVTFQKAYEHKLVDFPVFIKPTRGCGSIGAMKVTDMEVLEVLCRHSEVPLLIQEYCEGREFGADCYIDLISHQVTDVFMKEKLRMRAGETEKSVTFDDPNLKNLIIRTIKSLSLSGPIDMDIFEKNGKYFISEINPRFGGGYPHAYAAGMNVPEYLAKNVRGITNLPVLQEQREELYVMKYSDISVKKML